MNCGYREIMVNKPGIGLFYTAREKLVYAVLLINDTGRERLGQWQYANLYRQVSANFENQGYRSRILGLICTDEPDQAVRFDYEETWIVDVTVPRLVLYEDQSGDFLNVRPLVERILDEVTGRAAPEKRRPGTVRKKYQYFSPFNTAVVVINVIVFLIMEFSGNMDSNRYLVSRGALYWPYVIDRGQFYRLITYMFLHSGLDHILNNMIVLLFIGDNLERAAGKLKYLGIYFGSGILAGVTSMLWNMYKGYKVVCVGASGAIFGVVGAVAYIVAVNKGRLEDISSRQIVLFVLFSLYGGLTSQGVDNAAHIGGLISGALLAAILYRKKKPQIKMPERE